MAGHRRRPPAVVRRYRVFGFRVVAIKVAGLSGGLRIWDVNLYFIGFGLEGQGLVRLYRLYKLLGFRVPIQPPSLRRRRTLEGVLSFQMVQGLRPLRAWGF